MSQSQSNNKRIEKLEEKKWSRDDFIIGEKLAFGKFARVYCAKVKNTNYLVALKVLHKEGLIQYGMTQYLQAEIRILSNLRHPNIIRMYQYFDDQTYCYLVEEYCAGGELWQYLADNGPIPEHQVSKYILQLTSALICIHHKNIIHRDIKPENLLLDCCDNLKLCDFGWSIHRNPDRTKYETKDKLKYRARRDTFCGTADYVAPEMALNPNSCTYDKYVDIWSCGVLTYELLLGRAPFSHQ